MFVAPVTVGDGAYTGAGTVVRQDVPPGALAINVAPQRNLLGWVQDKRPGTSSAQAAAAAGGEAPIPPEPALVVAEDALVVAEDSIVPEGNATA